MKAVRKASSGGNPGAVSSERLAGQSVNSGRL